MQSKDEGVGESMHLTAKEVSVHLWGPHKGISRASSPSRVMP